MPISIRVVRIVCAATAVLAAAVMLGPWVGVDVRPIHQQALYGIASDPRSPIDPYAYFAALRTVYAVDGRLSAMEVILSSSALLLGSVLIVRSRTAVFGTLWLLPFFLKLAFTSLLLDAAHPRSLAIAGATLCLVGLLVYDRAALRAAQRELSAAGSLRKAG